MGEDWLAVRGRPELRLALARDGDGLRVAWLPDPDLEGSYEGHLRALAGQLAGRLTWTTPDGVAVPGSLRLRSVAPR